MLTVIHCYKKKKKKYRVQYKPNTKKIDWLIYIDDVFWLNSRFPMWFMPRSVQPQKLPQLTNTYRFILFYPYYNGVIFGL